MKKYFVIPFIILFFLSACTFLFPAETNITIAKIDHPENGSLVIYLRHADEGYLVTVNGEAFDCVMVEDPPDTLKCSGPSLEPGEKAVIRFYEDDTSTKPFYSLEFDVPDYDEVEGDEGGDGQSGQDDLCPNDPKKTAPGVCGCGVAETDKDGDGTLDCNDECPNNPDMTKPGDNGCKTPEKDSDDDGIPDSEDKCPEDPEKNEPGVCGCGILDTDEDEDGVVDCEDTCPDVAYADLIGDPCDKDEDDDGVNDGGDQCPFDPLKREAGYCGCGESELDTDLDGTPDCVDLCPLFKKKTEPGVCGCEERDMDHDHDGLMNCEDKDDDNDGYPDSIDECPLDPLKKHLPCSCGSPLYSIMGRV